MDPQAFQSQTFNKAHALPADVYVDSQYDQWDRQRLIRPSWQLAGHISQLQQTGDHLVHDLAGIPIIVVNTGQNIEAFYNVCRHRGGPLAFESGNSKTLMCRYHGWNYHLNGQLKSAPEMHHNADFKVCDHKLRSIPLDIWQGFVFVSLAPPPMTLSALLSGVSDHIAPIDLNRFKFHHRDEFIIECNWKVYVENYLEGYHLPHVHPGLNRLLDYKSYQTELKKWHSYQFSPIEEADGLYGSGQAHYYFAYPNTMFNILPNRVQTNQVLPINTQRCRVIFDYHYTDIETESGIQWLAKDQNFSDEVQDEDIGICQAVQKGLASGAYVPGPLCQKREAALHQFQEWVRLAYRQEEQ